MNQNLISIFLLLLLQLPETPFALDFHYQNCSVPTTCGGQNIRFPFFISGKQQPFCGYPGFQLSCHGDDEDRHIIAYPLIQLSGNNYTVRNIDYQSNSVLVSSSQLSDFLNNSDCRKFALVKNLTFPSNEYELGPDQAEFFLIQNCSSAVVDSFSQYKIGCFAAGISSVVLALPKVEYPKFRNLVESRNCGREVVVAYVQGNENGTENSEWGMKEVLERGFELKWLASDCSRCQRSGGICGFDNKSNHFRCFCPERPHSVRCPSDQGTGNLAAKVSIGSGIAAALGVLLFIACFLRRNSTFYRLIFFWKKENVNGHQVVVEAFLKSYGPLQVRRYSYLEVKKMTNSFEQKLGQGGYGSVYKGKLSDDDECLVAVKILNKLEGNGEEFMNEVAAISRTSHVNIVTLLGFCFEGSERALIYEFMLNGSLDKFIFDSNTPKKDHNNHLAWETLDQISLGIARGLEYLHRGCNTRILHFDIKPHNILLDENFTPKISDFGLAKICNRTESIVSMLGARGTAGYIAPEVYCRNFGGVSHKSDVYSYGMMLSEMVGGRRNINAQVENTSEIYFPHWIYKRVELDEELGLKSILNEEDKVRARKMIIVSLWCIQTDPSSRPAMKQVIEMLEGSVDALQIPPKPYLSSPPKSPADSSSALIPKQQSGC